MGFPARGTDGTKRHSPVLRLAALGSRGSCQGAICGSDGSPGCYHHPRKGRDQMPAQEALNPFQRHTGPSCQAHSHYTVPPGPRGSGQWLSSFFQLPSSWLALVPAHRHCSLCRLGPDSTPLSSSVSEPQSSLCRQLESAHSLFKVHAIIADHVKPELAGLWCSPNPKGQGPCELARGLGGGPGPTLGWQLCPAQWTLCVCLWNHYLI